MDTHSLEHRVARLEVSSRRWKATAIGLGGLMVGMVVAGAGLSRPAPTEVRVENWGEMVGSDGVFNADGTLRTERGSTPVAMSAQGGSLDSVTTVSQVQGSVTVKASTVLQPRR